MKRRTKQNVGAWPNMRDDTLKAIADELARARKKHPTRAGNWSMLQLGIQELQREIISYDDGKGAASQVYARCAMIAAMAVRCLEEGTPHSKYKGNSEQAAFADFELTP